MSRNKEGATRTSSGRAVPKLGVLTDIGVIIVESYGGKLKAAFVQDHVWEAFKGLIPDGYRVAHLNGDVRDNSTENLFLEPGKRHRCELDGESSQGVGKPRLADRTRRKKVAERRRSEGDSVPSIETDFGTIVLLMNPKSGDIDAAFAHELVWQTFIGPIRVGSRIVHIDGNPANNRLENLRVEEGPRPRCEVVQGVDRGAC